MFAVMGRRSLSLITLVYNGGASLCDTLESVACQSVCPNEHIIVDGGSVDGSREVCESYAAKVPYKVRILHREPRGIYDALNCGVEAASCEVIGTLHGGDRFASQVVLERVLNRFSDASGVELPSLIYGDIVYLKRSGGRGRYYSGADFTPESLKWGYMCPHPSVYALRDVFASYGGYKTGYVVAADFEWLVRVMLAGQVRGDYLPLLMVEMQPGGVSCKWRHRLLTTPGEKLRALRVNGISVSPLRMAGRYVHALKTVFVRRND